jgi:hypothetical protein
MIQDVHVCAILCFGFTCACCRCMCMCRRWPVLCRVEVDPAPAGEWQAEQCNRLLPYCWSIIDTAEEQLVRGCLVDFLILGCQTWITGLDQSPSAVRHRWPRGGSGRSNKISMYWPMTVDKT